VEGTRDALASEAKKERRQETSLMVGPINISGARVLYSRKGGKGAEKDDTGRRGSKGKRTLPRGKIAQGLRPRRGKSSLYLMPYWGVSRKHKKEKINLCKAEGEGRAARTKLGAKLPAG